MPDQSQTISAETLTAIRRFNRTVARRIGALSSSYLSRGRPLGEARILFEIGRDGLDVANLRARMGLDSGYVSRLLRSLERQGLILVRPDRADARRRKVERTRRGQEEAEAYDRLSDELAASILGPLRAADGERLVRAMAEVERLIRASEVVLALDVPDGRDATACRTAYFAELAERFDGGFDADAGKISRDDGMRPPRGAFIVARLEEEPVACGGFASLDGAVAEVKRMWTARHARGLGIAGRILSELEKRARKAGFRALRLDTNRTLVEAQSFYRAQGYREIACYNDNPYAHLWFEKSLDPNGEVRPGIGPEAPSKP